MTTWNGHATCHHKIYGLDCAQYDRILARADGHCEICGTHVSETPDNRLGIDHDHRGGNGWNHVRGMLCTKCNCNLKYGERGDRPHTNAELAYLAKAWCLVEPPPEPIRDTRPVRMTVTIPRDLRDDLAAVLRRTDKNRDAVVESLIRSYVRRRAG